LPDLIFELRSIAILISKFVDKYSCIKAIRSGND
jgi:hypothetical protein